MSDNDARTDRLALLTERWLRAEEDAERLYEALEGYRTFAGPEIPLIEWSAGVFATYSHTKRKAGEA